MIHSSVQENKKSKMRYLVVATGAGWEDPVGYFF